MGTIYVNSLKELEILLILKITENLYKIGEEVKGVLRQELLQLWYQRGYEPKQYFRTEELLDSISVNLVKRKGNIFEVEIYYDTSKILPYSNEDGFWSSHESVITGESSANLLPLWIEEGQNSPIFSFKGVHPVRETIDWIKEDHYLLNRMKELLQGQGYKCI